jgi:ketosteroid isomerase-like protein
MSTRLISVLVPLVTLTACHSGNAEQNSEQAKKEIQQRFGDWAKAYEAKDIDGVMDLYAPNDAFTAYDIVAPLQLKGSQAYRQDYTDFFAQFSGPLHVEDQDVHYIIQDNLAVAYGLEKLSGRLIDGTAFKGWMRFTDALQRMHGRWYVVHEHVSVPVDMNSGKARFDLTPQ